MRPSENSGAGAERFGAGNTETSDKRPFFVRLAHRTIRSVSPVTIAVTLTAMLGATLFVAFDTLRSIEQARDDLVLVGKALAQDLAALDPEAAVQTLAATTSIYSNTITANMSGSGALPTEGLLSHRVAAGDLGYIVLQGDDGAALSGVAPRAFGAYSLAFLIGAVSFRRRKAAPAPREDNHRALSALITAIPYGIACWSREGNLLACNARYLASIGQTGQRPSGYQDAVKQLISGGYMKLVSDGDANRTLELHRKDGNCLLIDERPLGDGAFVTLVSDVTERKKTDALLTAIREDQRELARRYHEEKLKAEAASLSKTNFLAHLSHDVRTPLNHIIGFAELIRHQAFGPIGDPRYLDYVSNIKTSGEQLLGSFATILDLVEMQGGQKALRSEPLAVDEVLEVVSRRFKPQAERGKVRLMLGAQCGAVINGDMLGLQRMVGNIVENALRYTPAGGRITLAAFAAQDGAVIEVSDTGIGMSEERLSSLSQPFAHGDANCPRDGVGPGLGIPIARAIAELSGGNMAIDSSPQFGTTVAFSLPLREAAPDIQLQAA